MRLKYGRSLIGTSSRKIVTTIRSRNYSVCAAITKNRVLSFNVCSGSYNSERFCEYMRDLIAILGDSTEKYHIIMDNCSINKVQEVRSIIENSGHEIIFLPPYSPQLNPIEETFSKWKHYIRAMNVQNADGLFEAIVNGHMYIVHCKYKDLHSVVH